MVRKFVLREEKTNSKVNHNNNYTVSKGYLISPSLSIMKPNLNSMFSIFNRIFGVILFFVLNYFLIYILYINIWNIDTLNCMNTNSVSRNIINFSTYNGVLMDIFIYNISLIMISILIYHIIYSSFKIYTKSEKIYQIISSNINMIDKLYLYILKIIFILSIFFVLSLSLNFMNSYVELYEVYNIFISIICLKLLLYSIVKVFYKKSN